MNLGELREMIEDLPDCTTVVIESSDHSYVEADAVYTQALEDCLGDLIVNVYNPRHEYYDEDLEEGDELVPVLVVS